MKTGFISVIAPEKCTKCAGLLDEGFLLEVAHGNSLSPTRWVSGAPVKSFWMGLKLDGHAQYEVRTYRCRNCGFLESYAN